MDILWYSIGITGQFTKSENPNDKNLKFKIPIKLPMSNPRLLKNRIPKFLNKTPVPKQCFALSLSCFSLQVSSNSFCSFPLTQNSTGKFLFYYLFALFYSQLESYIVCTWGLIVRLRTNWRLHWVMGLEREQRIYEASELTGDKMYASKKIKKLKCRQESKFSK